MKHTDGGGVPLGAQENNSYVKYLFFDLGVMQTMLGIPSAEILLASEVDYLRVRDGVVLPVEVKASTQGAMQSLWVFMRKRKLEKAVRTSLENFGQFEYFDPDSEADGAIRHVDIVPLYALSNLRHTAEDFRNMISRETMEKHGDGKDSYKRT